MRGTDPVQRRDVIQIELMPFRVCLNLTWFDFFRSVVLLFSLQCLYPCILEMKNLRLLNLSQNTVVCVAIACFGFVCSDEFWLAVVWFIGLCIDAPCPSNWVLILFSANTD